MAVKNISQEVQYN